jgi:hypothetical protein
MSSIEANPQTADTNPNVKKIRSFYDEKLLPVAKSLRDKGLPLFDLAPDPSLSTYYMPRARKSLKPTDFEEGGCQAPEDLEVKLQALWKNGGVHGKGAEAGYAMAKLAAPIAALSKELYAVEEQDAEVSPYTYVMF